MIMAILLFVALALMHFWYRIGKIQGFKECDDMWDGIIVAKHIDKDIDE